MPAAKGRLHGNRDYIKPIRKLLFNVVSECYERRSLIITTNLDFASWNSIFAAPKLTAPNLTAALLDRVIHHCHTLDFTKRDSRRLLQALAKK